MFKKNDLVFCVCDSEQGLKVGESYTVTASESKGGQIEIEGGGRCLGSFPARSFVTERAWSTIEKLFSSAAIIETRESKTLCMLASAPELGKALMLNVVDPMPSVDENTLQEFVDNVRAAAQDFLVVDQFAMLRGWDLLSDKWRDEPTWPSFRDMLVRIHLIQEELSELSHAMAKRDWLKVLDALGDLDVVLTGAWVHLGLHSARRATSQEILRSNLSKLDPSTGRITKDESGRILKGPTYSPPDLQMVLDQTFPTGALNDG
jgi:hypothetical protein